MRNRSLWSSAMIYLIYILFSASLALATVALPDQLKDVPVYPDSKVVQTMNMENNAMAALEVKAKPEAIIEFYKQNLTGKGWKVFSQINEENGSMIQFQNGKQMLHLQVQSEEDSDTTSYHLVLHTQQ